MIVGAPSGPPYSALRAINGSTRVARHAGTRLAATARIASTSTEVANVVASVGRTSYRRPLITRVIASAPAPPITTPTAISDSDRRRTDQTTVVGRAPGASARPHSCPP